jgi:hypothetical protein
MAGEKPGGTTNLKVVLNGPRIVESGRERRDGFWNGGENDYDIRPD